MSIADSGDSIMFVAVARATDKVMVCSYVPREGDYNKTQYFNTVNEVLGAPDFNTKVAPGSRYRLVSDTNAFNFTTDHMSRVFISITSAAYPERLAFPMLNDLMKSFQQDHGDEVEMAREGGLNKAAKPLLKKLVADYNDPAKKDKLSAVQSKVDDVKLTMQSNIDGMLRNLDKTERIETDTQALQEQARMFDTQATRLKSRERWKSRKLTLIIAFIVIFILTILIITLVKG